MKVLFRRGKNNGVIGWLISAFTVGSYSHCEIVVREDNSFFYTVAAIFEHNAIEKIARKKTAKFYKNWDIVEIKTVNDKEAIDFLREQVGKKYDFLGILFSQIFPFKSENAKEWFCSELCSATLKKAGVKLKEPNKIYSPSKLFHELMDLQEKEQLF